MANKRLYDLPNIETSTLSDDDYIYIAQAAVTNDGKLTLRDLSAFLSIIPNIPDSSTTEKGIIQIATTSDIDTGTDNTKALTIGNLRASNIKFTNAITLAPRDNIEGGRLFFISPSDVSRYFYWQAYDVTSSKKMARLVVNWKALGSPAEVPIHVVSTSDGSVDYTYIQKGRTDTPAVGDNSDKIATTQYVNSMISSLTTTPVYFYATKTTYEQVNLTQRVTQITGLVASSSSGSGFSNSRFTAPVKGIYWFLTSINGFNPDGKYVSHRPEPSQYTLNPTVPAVPLDPKSAPASTLLILNAGDYVDIALLSADATPEAPVTVTLVNSVFQGVLIQRLP